MKKLVLALILVFISCSSDEVETETINTNSILIKKVVSVSNGNSNTTLFTYNGTKLSQITLLGNYVLNYTYNNNNIVKIERNYNNLVEFETLFEYDSQQRVSLELAFYYTSNSSEKTIYTYNNNNTISFQKYFGDIYSQPNLGNNGLIYNDSNNETYKIEQFNQGSLSSKTVWTYDTKNNPLKNVTGYNKQPFVFGKFFNNTTTDNYNSNNEIISNSTFQYTYNVAAFPANCTQLFYNNNLISTTQISYFYE